MYQEVLDFWFEEMGESRWWVKDGNIDSQIRDRFGEIHRRAVLGELFAWRKRPEGRLAEILILDQFSRNMYRDKPQAFTSDPQALVLAQEAIAVGADQALTPTERTFIYLPFMHSESLVIHKVAVELFEQNGIANNLEFELKHKMVIERFGRYPHRNQILGRESTPDELAYLAEPGAGF